jgi:hypothetical protein
MQMLRQIGLPFVMLSALSGQRPDATTTTPAVSTSIATLHRRAVSPHNVNTHIITVVPLTGAGTYNDPKRPMYLPAARASVSGRTDILGFIWVPSDDGKSAIVEYVAANKTALQQIYGDKKLKIFEKGKNGKDEIEAEMKRYRKNFSLNEFGVTVR